MQIKRGSTAVIAGVNSNKLQEGSPYALTQNDRLLHPSAIAYEHHFEVSEKKKYRLITEGCKGKWLFNNQ
jgi:hypothetical protein